MSGRGNRARPDRGGAGKSTYVQFTLAPRRPGVPFVTADVLAAQHWPDRDEALRHGRQASELAARARQRLLEQRRAFIAETVASHPSEVALVADAEQAGYFVAVHVLLVPEDLAVARVEHRVAAGGHDVPDDKIRARWQRLWGQVADMVALADHVEVFDNAGDGPRTVALFVDGELVGPTRWPSWTPPGLTALTR